MAKKGFRVLDSDLHIVEPPDLWQRYTDPEYRDMAPKGLTRSLDDMRMAGPDGKSWGRDPKVGEHHLSSGHQYSFNQQRYRRYGEQGWTGEAQLAAMDAEGVDVAVLYPSRGLYALSVPGMEPRLAAAIARAYNDWLHDFCQADESRLMGAGMVSPFDIEDAVSETRRCVTELWFRGVLLRPNLVDGRNWNDPYYEPLWSTLEEMDVPVGFHEGVGSALPHVGDQFGDNSMLEHVICHPGEMMLTTMAFCGGGVLERHPTLRTAFLEGNCSWVPFLLWRLDEHWERHGDVYAQELKLAPSEYFKRQCYVSVEADEEPVKYVIDYMGSDRLLFSTDFPHADSRFPEAVDQFLQLPITEKDKAKILWDNCAGYYGIQV